MEFANDLIRIITAEGAIVWINRRMVVSISKNNNYKEVDIASICLVDNSMIKVPGTPDEVAKRIFRVY